MLPDDMAVPVIFMCFRILRSIKFGVLGKLGKEILDNSYYHIPVLGFCIHISGFI